MWIVDRFIAFIKYDPRATTERIDKSGSEVSHDLTNIAARVDMLTRLQREMRVDRRTGGESTGE